MEENEKITKIVVNSEDELTDIISGILSAQTSRIILTFAEPSDLLISTIDLSVIKETVEEEGKLLICQIIKNPTGTRNAKLAGIVTIDTPNNPTEEDWAEAKKQKDENTKIEEKPTSNASSAQSSQVQVTVHEPSEFEKRINEAIQKNKTERNLQENSKTKNDDGLIISVGEDLPNNSNISENSNDEFVDLSKVDFKNIAGEKKETKKPLFNFKNIFKSHKNTTNREIKPLSPFHYKIKKLLPILLISIAVVGGLVAFIYFNTVPFVRIRIFVKAQDVSIEKTFTGDANIHEIDFTNLKIPIKTESVDESRSTTITATGKAYKGDKASGSVTLTYAKTDCSGVTSLSLAAGQVIVSSDGKSYSLDSATTIACNSFATVTVHAVEIGEEYNTPNSYFTVQGYTSSDLFGLKSGDFSGGSKTEYTVLSLADVNGATDELKKAATEDATNALNEKQGTDWTIITDSIKSEAKQDSIKTDVAVGAEASQANLSLTVSSSATYYLSAGFDQGVKDLLTSEAQSKNLFQSDSNLDLVLGDNIQKNMSVVQNSDAGVLIKLTASGTVEPKIDKEKIVSDLKAMNWTQGTKYLDSIKYSDKATIYEFNPVNFPKSLYYFPKRQGGILIEVDEI